MPSDDLVQIYTDHRSGGRHFGPSSFSVNVNVRAGGVREINCGTPIAHMDAPSVSTWFVEQALDHNDLGPNEVGRLFAGNGPGSVSGARAVAEEILGDASLEITSAINDGLTPVIAFNEASSSWPYEARLLLAKHEYENYDRDDEDYEEDIERLVSGGDNMPELTEQTELDLFYGDNPVADETLSLEEARTVLVLRSNGDSADGNVIDSIYDHVAFRDCYKETEDIDEALQSHRFDQSVPPEVLSEAAPPEEWSDHGLDPLNINEAVCHWCPNNFFKIVGDGGVAYVNEAGNIAELIDVGSDDNPYHVIGGDDSGNLCEDCAERFEDNFDEATFFDPDDSRAVKVKRTDNIFVDCSEVNDDFDSINGLEEQRQHELLSAATNGPPDYYSIGPNPDIGEIEDQAEAIREVIDDPTGIENGPVIAYVSQFSIGIHVPRDNPKAAQNVKAHLEAHV